MVRCLRTFLGSLHGVASVAMLGPQGAVWAQSFAACYLYLGKLLFPCLREGKAEEEEEAAESSSWWKNPSPVWSEEKGCAAGWCASFSPCPRLCWMMMMILQTVLLRLPPPFFLFLFFLTNLKTATGSLLLRSFTVSKYCCWWGVIINLRYTYLVSSSVVTVSRVAETPSLCLCGL